MEIQIKYNVSQPRSFLAATDASGVMDGQFLERHLIVVKNPSLNTKNCLKSANCKSPVNTQLLAAGALFFLI